LPETSFYQKSDTNCWDFQEKFRRNKPGILLFELLEMIILSTKDYSI
jgi:hypothetical protein